MRTAVEAREPPEPPYEIEIVGRDGDGRWRVALPNWPRGERIEVTVTQAQLMRVREFRRRAFRLDLIPGYMTQRQWDVARDRAFQRWWEKFT